MNPVHQVSQRRVTIRRRSPNAEFLRHHPNEGIPDELFDEIARRFPSYVSGKDWIELMLPKGHGDLERVMRCAHELGLRIHPDRSSPSQVEIMDYTRYSDDELAAAKYLEIKLLSPNVWNIGLLKGGRHLQAEIVPAGGKPREIEFGSIPNLPHLIAVRGWVREELESLSPDGLILVPVSGGDSGAGGNDSWAMIWSDRELPHMASQVFDDAGLVYDSVDVDYRSLQRPRYILDAYEVNPPLKYAERLPEFDVALSAERLGGSEPFYHRIIYSQKMRVVLERLGMKLECMPVLDEAGSMGRK